jgi:hypothetical protein
MPDASKHDFEHIVIGLGGLGSGAAYWLARRAGSDVLGISFPFTMTQEQVTYFASPHLEQFQPDRFPIWLWMDDPCFYGLQAFGETRGVKAAQDVGGREVTIETRTFDLNPETKPRVAGFTDHLYHLILPALALGIGGAAFYSRLLRTTMLDVLRSDYIRVARAKGVSGHNVILRHAFPNCTNALVTQLGLDIGFFLTGVLLIEVPFSWPGIGQQAWQAITNLDVPLILGTVLFGAVAILGANIVVDIVYAFIDPRVRYE